MDTVADLKRYIFEKEAIPPSGQRLFLDGKALEDAATLLRMALHVELLPPSYSHSRLECRVTDGSVVYLDINTRRSFGESYFCVILL
jgi:hypothetical protein